MEKEKVKEKKKEEDEKGTAGSREGRGVGG